MHYQVACNHPWYLLLIPALLAPLVWWSFRSLAALGPVRRWLAIGTRSLVLLAVILALAELQLVRSSPNLTVLYLLDHSLSISSEQGELALRYVNQAIRRQRHKEPLDRAGVIVFGREPAIEIPPLDEDQQLRAVESRVDREFTNLAGALKLAQASFPHETARRVVILTDGNENLGNVAEQARALLDAGISIDVVPLVSAVRGDVAVEKVTIPSDIRKAEPFNVRVLLNNTTPAAQGGGAVRGRLEIYRRANGVSSTEAERPLLAEEMTLAPGRRLVTYADTVDAPDFYTYEARWVPAQGQPDVIPQNNVASTFTQVRGSGRLLIIEDDENKGEFAHLVERLRAQNLEVTLRAISQPDEVFTDLGQLQPFDTIVLANVPREHFSDDQIQILVRNTQVMGAGLVLLGGPNSFGAGGWTNSPIEEAMPVDFQIKGAEVTPVGALAMVMHASEIAQGNFWQQKIAEEAIKTLGGRDFCGVLHWSGVEQWLWRPGMLSVGPNRGRMLALLQRMAPGDMPNFDPGLRMAYQGLMAVQGAAIRHCIVISDGDPTAPSNSVLQQFRSSGIRITTVAVGAHGPAESGRLSNIASVTGGKYYQVNNPNMLPRIFQREARRVARPLVFEKKEGFQPQVIFPHEITQGVDRQLPPITGFVRTSKKPTGLAEMSIVSPIPDRPEDNPILASWTYGVGKTAVLTTDAGKRWATDWTAWSGYDKFFSQLMRWSMRASGEAGKFAVSTDVHDGQLKVVVTALGQDDEYLNNLVISGTVVGPDMKPANVELKQVAPGRYVGQSDAGQKGNYFVTLSPGQGKTPIRTGASVPYSDEFRDRETNEALLKSMASESPKGGPAGRVIQAPAAAASDVDRLEAMLGVDTFRHDLPKATASQDVWHLLVLLGSCLFFFDVFVRRVTVSFAWVAPAAGWVRDRVLRREAQPAAAPVIARLRSRKAEVVEGIEQRRAAARFESGAEAAPAEPLAQQLASAGQAPAASQPGPAGQDAGPSKPAEEEDTYTNRLLKAKQRVWDERNKESP